MKKILIFITALIPALSNAQKPVEEWEYNDSVEYIMLPATVTDTAAVERFADKQRDSWRERVDSLNTVKGRISDIRMYSEKKLPEELLPIYTKYYEWVKKNYEADPAAFAQCYAEIDMLKAEKRVAKGKVFVQVDQVLGKMVTLDIDPLIKSTQDSIRLGDFDVYAQVNKVDTSNMPKKKVMLKQKNKNYRPDLFKTFRDLNREYDISEYDIKTQSRGWEWVSGPNFTREVEAYPISYEYRVYKEHPNYKVITRNLQPVVFDTAGNLVRVCYMTNLSNNDIYDIVEGNLLVLDCRADYEANKYNVKNESAEVQSSLKSILGYSDNVTNNMRNYLIKGMTEVPADDKPLKDYIAAKKAAALSTKAQAEKTRSISDTAMRIYQQFEKDNSVKYKYLYKVERMGDNDFKIRFVTYDMKPLYDVYVTYFGTAPYTCECTVSRIKKY